MILITTCARIIISIMSLIYGNVITIAMQLLQTHYAIYMNELSKMSNTKGADLKEIKHIESLRREELSSRLSDARPLSLAEFSAENQRQLKSNHYLERQTRFESSARSYPRRIPVSLARTKGVYVRDTEGNTYIDCLAGAGSLALGHNHPEIHDALRQHLDDDAPLLTLDLTTPAKDQFTSRLFKALPTEFSRHARIQFCSPSGADAVEAAIKLVKTATGRQTILAFSGAYHGMTHATLGITGNLSARTPITNLMPGVQFLPFPYQYRCPFGLEGEASVTANLHYIEHLLQDPESGVLPPAAIIVEAIQGEGGVIPAPARWLQGLREITARHGIPLIMDEVQSGIGRTGNMFAFEHSDIVPDVVVISKAIGGGLPLSVIVYKEELDQWTAGAHAGTFRGNQLAMTAGTVTLNYIHEHQLVQQAANMGMRLMQHLTHIQQDCEFVGDVRGRGLMIGVEIIDTTQTGSSRRPPTFSELASDIQQHCLRNGLILESGGRHGSTLRFLPPLIISAEEIDKVAEIFNTSIQQAVTNLGLRRYTV